MPIAISTLKPGDVVYDARKVRMGNTTMKSLSVWDVVIRSVDVDKGEVVASWNGNRDQVFRARGGKMSWRRTKPETR